MGFAALYRSYRRQEWGYLLRACTH